MRKNYLEKKFSKFNIGFSIPLLILTLITTKDMGHQAYPPADLFDFRVSVNILLKYYFLIFLNNLTFKITCANQRSHFCPNYRIAFQFSFAFVSSFCSSVSYRMKHKKETKFNFRLKAMRFDEAICEAEHNSSDNDQRPLVWGPAVINK